MTGYFFGSNTNFDLAIERDTGFFVRILRRAQCHLPLATRRQPDWPMGGFFNKYRPRLRPHRIPRDDPVARPNLLPHRTAVNNRPFRKGSGRPLTKCEIPKIRISEEWPILAPNDGEHGLAATLKSYSPNESCPKKLRLWLECDTSALQSVTCLIDLSKVPVAMLSFINDP